jgi:peptidoglycan/xylan/chitin deacetylase (PgdA/CDA1 family)
MTALWIGLCTAFGVFAVYIVLPTVARYYFRKAFLSSARKTGYVYLTFDDGPDPESTPAILEVLTQTDVKATFFLVGARVARYPHLARQIAEMGHPIAEHGYTHLHPWTTGPIRVAADLLRGGKAVLQYRSSNDRGLFRPPYGKLNLVTLLYIWLGRRQCAFWDIDPKDYSSNSSTEVARFVMDRISPGSVILLHDGRLHGGRSAEVTPQAARVIIEGAHRLGLRLNTLSEVK